jgi:Tfp pilus assembly protein PilF
MTRLAIYGLVTAALVAVTAAQTRLATRESAYRANNIGVAYLEQYNFASATASFREALQADPTLSMARLNLGIALKSNRHEAPSPDAPSRTTCSG